MVRAITDEKYQSKTRLVCADLVFERAASCHRFRSYSLGFDRLASAQYLTK